MVSSGGCLWNQNASLVCSSETHHCDLQKIIKKSTFNLEGQAPGVPTQWRKVLLEEVIAEDLGFKHCH